MKAYRYKLIALCGVLLFATSACELVKDIDEYEPLYALEATKAVVDEKSAENALTGIYSKLTELQYVISSRGLMSGDLASGDWHKQYIEVEGWEANNPSIEEDQHTLRLYTRYYNAINNCNWLIQEAKKLDEKIFSDPKRLNEIIGEAKLIRAYTHFQLLITFGQFYDINSPYGIDIRLNPVNSDKAQARKSVSESYSAIINDLNDAIKMAPDLRESKGYVNKAFAKALLAKVHLFMGNYSEASSTAKDLIETGGSDYALNATFESLFKPKDSPLIFDSPEVLFGYKGTPGENGMIYIGMQVDGGRNGFDPVNIVVTAESKMEIDGQIIDADNGSRFSSFFYPVPANPYMPTTYQAMKYTTRTIKSNYNTPGDYEMWIQMRMAEVYLILAEADARANNAVTTTALKALNDIRIRAGATTTGSNGFETYPAGMSLDQFLTAVRTEKAIELYLEMGESWFDLIRYDYADGFGTGFQVSDVKPSATNKDKFILPIPISSYRAAAGVIKQNPSYE